MSKGYLAALVAAVLAVAVVAAVAVTGKQDSTAARIAGQQDSVVGAAASQSSTIDAAASLLDQAMAGRRLLVLGEMHGTREIPAIAGALAARWSQAQPLLLGLEIASTDQARVDRYLASAGSARDRAALLASGHWQEPMHDGRDSMAMAALIERMRALRVSGADVAITLFDAPGQGERNQRMATALRVAVAAHPRARVLVLTGNVHAMTGVPPAMFDADGRPIQLPMTMARHLADLSPRSVDVRAARGEYWACMGDACRVQAVASAMPPVPQPRLQPGESGDSWDMRLWLPRFTASSPAVSGPSPRIATHRGSRDPAADA